MPENAANEGPMQLTKEIAKLINDQLLVEVSSPEDDLLASGVLDSLTLVQLLFDLEQHFGVTIPLEELEIDDFRSVHSIARLVQARNSAFQCFTPEEPIKGAAKRNDSRTRAVFAQPVLGRDAGSS